MPKAVALLSGGLDSMLAAKLVAIQGVAVTGVHFVSVFNSAAKPGRRLAARLAADAVGIPLKTFPFTETQIEILRNPPHGYGSAANPCIDCHIAMIRRAGEFMREIGADFVVTGEVAGQRPMSQRTFILRVIEQETGLEGLILRPLSAKALQPTLPEKRGLVNRDLLEGIVGRTRTRQMQLARRFGIEAYPTPAGGCLLTDREFGRRVMDLVEHGELTVNNAHLVKVGRHYRLDAATKAVVGRNERENGVIETYARPGDLLITTEDVPGPTTLVRGNASQANVETAAALTVRSSKAKSLAAARVRVRPARSSDPGAVISVAPAGDDVAAAFTLAPSEVSS